MLHMLAMTIRELRQRVALISLFFSQPRPSSLTENHALCVGLRLVESPECAYSL